MTHKYRKCLSFGLYTELGWHSDQAELVDLHEMADDSKLQILTEDLDNY